MRVIITGGGTGGHVNPAIAIGLGLKERSKVKLLYVGMKESIEKDLAEKEGIEFHSITAAGFKSKKPVEVVKTLFKTLKGAVQAYFVIKKFRPDIIVGTGGYVSFPVVYMGQLMGIDTVIHEQNAFPGSTNRKLSKKARFVFTSYQESHERFPSADNLVYSGNPVKNVFYAANREESRKKLGFEDDKLNIVSVGGSGGAKAINDLMFDLVNEFNGSDKISITHITGKTYYEKYMKFRKDIETEFADNINIIPFSYDLPQLYSGADLVIARAGALTIAELMVTGTPAVIIPSPNVKDNHQEFNARAFENTGRGIVILEKDLNFYRVRDMINDFAEDRKVLDDMRGKRENDKDEAANIIVDNILKLVFQK